MPHWADWRALILALTSSRSVEVSSSLASMPRWADWRAWIFALASSRSVEASSRSRSTSFSFFSVLLVSERSLEISSTVR